MVQAISLLTAPMALLGLFAVVGNGLSIAFLVGGCGFGRDAKLRRTVLALLLVNLAVSDLMVGLVAVPAMLTIYWTYHGRDDERDFFLSPIWSLVDLFITATVLNTLLLSVDRYVAVAHPLFHSRVGNFT